MRYSVFGLALAIFLGFAMPQAGAQQAAASNPVKASPAASAKAVRFTSVEGITEYRLANGLRVLLAPDASKPTTTVNITYMVGSRHENYGETGMAHLLEHLLFKGTPGLPGKTIVEEFARRGMRMNGSTFYDRTNYHETFAASDDNLDWALKMEADRMVNSFVARSDLDSEMTVVRNEMEAGENDPGRMLWQNMTAAAYQWHNYGKSTIGARSDVENVKIENLQAFYRNYYQPDNATLIVTGKFDEARVLGRVELNFGAIPKPGRRLPALYTQDPAQEGEREVSVSRVGDASMIGLLYHIAAGAHADAAYADLLAFVLGDTPTGRLHKALVEPQKAASVEAEALALHDPGYFMAFANLNKTQSREDARRILLQVTEGLAKEPITEAELKRAKTALLNEVEKSLSNPTSFGIRLSESVAQGDWRLYFLRRDRIEKATLADVQKVAENYLVQSNRTYGQFIPTEKPVRAVIPAAPVPATLLADYKGKVAVAAGEVFDPSPENIDKRTTLVSLPNGMKGALLAKNTRGNTVNGQIVLRMGDEKSLFNQREVAQFVAQLMLRGTSKMTRQQIADRLDELKAKVNIGTPNGNAVTIGFETRRAQLGDTLSLIRDILRTPSFPQAEFEQFRTEWLTGDEEKRRQPDAIAQKELGRYDNPYPKGDVRYVPTFDEQIAIVKGLKHADVKAFHEAFYGADAGQFAIVGDFDQVAVQAQMAGLFGDWRSKQSFARVGQPYRDSKGTALSFETPDKANAFYIAGVGLQIKDDAPDAPALALANRVLGGGGLKSRIADRLRQKDGISYGAGSFLQLNPYEANSMLGFYAIYAPENLGKLKAGMAQELARFIAEGVSAQELEDAKSGMLQGQLINRSQDGSLAGTLANHLFLGRSMKFVADQEARLKAVALADVQAAIAKYINPERLAQIYAGDFAKGGKKP